MGTGMLHLLYHEGIHIIAGAGLTLLLADLLWLLKRNQRRPSETGSLLPALVAAAILVAALGAGRELLDLRDGSDTVAKAVLDELFVIAGCVLGVRATLGLRK
jgi:hypothetical protein